MSQGDYIKYKKITTKLAVDTETKRPPVISSQDYSDYKEYVLENTIINSKTVYRRIAPTKSQTVLDMEKKQNFIENYEDDSSIPVTSIMSSNCIDKHSVFMHPIGPQGINMGVDLSNCPSFLLCKNTNLRKNRLPLSSVYFTPTPQPLNWQQTKNASWKKTGCKCILNSTHTNTNICSCKLGI